MKRICFLGYNFTRFGGLERAVTSVANELCKNEDYEVHMVSICGSIHNKFFYSLNLKIKTYNLGINPDFRFKKIIFKAFSPLKKYLNEYKFDVVFLSEYTTPPVAAMVKFFTKAKFVFCDHGTLSNQLNDRKSTIFRKIGNLISKKIVVLTNTNKEDYKKYFKTSKDRLEVIPNWLDDEVLEKVKSYNFDSKIIMSCARLTSEKGFDMLPEIAEIVFEKHPDWIWKIFGDGPEKEKIQKKINELKLEKNVIFYGYSDKMYENYSKAGIFVSLSYREGFSLVLLEAKANAIPLISFNCVAGPSDIICGSDEKILDKIGSLGYNIENKFDKFKGDYQNGSCCQDGFLISCYNKEEMAEKICLLIGNKKLRMLFSENSKKNLEKFSKEKILQKWEGLIRRL